MSVDGWLRRAAHGALFILAIAGSGLIGSGLPAQAQRTTPEKPMGPPASAALSPDGLRAAWPTPDNRSIVSATRASATAPWGEANRLLTTRGVVHKIVFSPDNKSLAYENQRTWLDNGKPDDTWQFICIYDIATRQISYLDPSFDTDSDPVWADTSQINFTRKVAGLPDAHLTRPVIRDLGAAWQPPPLRSGERFTMASIIAAPFIYPPTPSADGTSLAYITREAKDRNVYFLRLGQPAKRLANYPGDDGQDMADSPAVSKHGGAVAYMRGGRINRQNEAPNPTYFPDMPQQQVWLVGTLGDTPRLLGPGKDPMFTPDDQSVLWRSENKIMRASLTWAKGKLIGIGSPEEFLSGTREGIRFSADGSKAAYENGADVEIYDFKAKTTFVVPHDKGLSDRGPVWSPGGDRLVFRREAAEARRLRSACGAIRYCGPAVSNPPWSIWVIDMASLTPHQIWQAKPGQGSVFYSLDQSLSPAAHGDQMFWFKDRIVFPWEGDGWRHLYAVPASGGDAKLLTPGNGETETVAQTLDGSHLVYATNIGELGRRHIAEVSFDGGSPSAVTSGDQDQWSPTPMTGGGIAYINAGWVQTPTVMVKSAKGKTMTASLPKAPTNFPAALMVKPQLVDFPATDGQVSHGQLFVPVHPNGCAIIFSHGGQLREMLPGFHYMDAYQYLYEMNQYLASRGCVVLSVDYRSGIMYGEAFRNAPGWGFAGNTHLNDFMGGAAFLKARKDVDASRGIGIFGLSWGGVVTSQLLALHSDTFSVGFDMAGVHTAGDAAGDKYSAYGNVGTWSSPTFLAQGDDDMNVDFDEGTTMARAIQVKRPMVEFKQQVLPGQTHDLYLSYSQLVTIYTEGSDWLLSHLKVQ